MGNDGGTVELRRDLVVKQKKTDKKLDPAQRAQLEWSFFLWTQCRISKQPLDPKHVVCCKMGYLYNKDSFLEQLLRNKAAIKLQQKKIKSESSTDAAQQAEQLVKLTSDGTFDHLREKSDAVNVHFELNPRYRPEQTRVVRQGTLDAEQASVENAAMFICPITNRETGNSTFKFYLIRKCGHVLSEKALKMSNGASASKTENCLVCSAAYDPSTELTLINPSDEEEKEQRKKAMEEIKQHLVTGLQSSSSSTKKRKHQADAASSSEAHSASHAQEALNDDQRKSKKAKVIGDVVR